MKCSLCGAELIAGNNNCPSCGALNMTFNQADAQAQPNTANTPNPNTQDNLEVLTPIEESVEVLDMPQEAAKTETSEGEIIDSSTSGFVDLDEGEVETVQATENMEAPSLDLNNENLTSNAHDISSADNVATYDPTQALPEDKVDDDMPKEAGINFTLPEVKEAAEDTQGMGIKEIETKGETVGEESKPVKGKFSLKIFKKKTLPRNVVLILLGVVLVIGILLGSLLFGKKVYSPGSTSTNKKGNNIPHVADGKNNTTYVGNIIYKIPQQYDFDKQDGGIIIYGSSDDYRIFIKALKGSYEKIANAKESIRLSLDNINVKTNQIYETSINEHNYIVVQSVIGTTNRMYGLRSGINDYIFYIEIVSSANDYDTSIFKIADDIIESVELNEKYSNMEKLTLEDFSQLIVTTAEAKHNA